MGHFTKKNQMATSYNDNQFMGVTFNPLTRSRSLTNGVESTAELQSTGNSKGMRRSRKKSRNNTKSRSRSSSRDRAQSPMAFAFKNTLFTDRESRKIMKDVELYHNKPMRLKKVLYEEGEKLKRITRDKLVLSDETVSYSKLLDLMMFDTETLVVERGVSYKSLEFKDEACEVQVRPTMSQGKVFLSNTRLLFVTAEQLKGSMLSTYGDAVRGPGGYIVNAYHNDELHYQYVPLTCIKAVELHTRTGGKAEVELATVRSFAGVCSWLGDIFGCGFCMERWQLNEEGPVGTEYNERILILSVVMPPFNTPMRILMHVASEVSLNNFTQFVSLMQQFAPEVAQLNGLPSLPDEARFGKMPLAKVGAVMENRVREEENENEGETINNPVHDVYAQLGDDGPLRRSRRHKVGIDINHVQMRERQLFYDPQRGETYAALSDLMSVYHGTRVLPQTQMPGKEPQPVEVVYAEDIPLAKRSIAQKAWDLSLKRDSMIGRELPTPEPGPSTSRKQLGSEDGFRSLRSMHSADNRRVQTLRSLRSMEDGEGVRTLRSLRSTDTTEHKSMSTVDRSVSTIPKYQAPTPLDEREATLRHYKGARNLDVESVVDSYVESERIRKAHAAEKIINKTAGESEYDSEESDISGAQPLPPAELQKVEDDLDEIYMTKNHMKRMFTADQIPERTESEVVEMKPKEVSSSLRSITFSKKSKKSKKNKASSQKKETGEEETNIDSEMGTVRARSNRGYVNTEVGMSDQPPYNPFLFTTTNPLTGIVRCVCAKCLESVQDGTTWEPISHSMALEMAEGDNEKALALKKGFCVCAKCTEKGKSSEQQEMSARIRDDVSIV